MGIGGRSGIPHLTPALSAPEGGEGGASTGGEPLAVYIHWPFCRSKCPYCDFNSHVRERIDEPRWTRALIADLDRQAALVPEGEVVSVFFGGGTPSLMPPETVAAVIERAFALFLPAGGVEITLEANPTSVEAAKLAPVQCTSKATGRTTPQARIPANVPIPSFTVASRSSIDRVAQPSAKATAII